MQNQQHTMIERELRNTGQLAAWTLAWVAFLALARFGPEHVWNDQRLASWIAVTASLVVGIGWIVAHARFLRNLDDLQRKINLDALAIALGVGFVTGFAGAVAHHADLITSASVLGNIALLPVLMAVVYVIAILVGNMRYR